jgi:hypothetical protein
MRISAARRGRLRSATPLASAVLVAACTASTGTLVAGSPPAARQAAVPSADPCGLPVANEAKPTAGRIVLGVISIASGAVVQPAVRVDQGWWRYWQKTGLEIRAGSQAVTITVPKAWRTRAAITWGVNVGIVSTLRLPGCRAAPGTWNAYAGGFYLRSSSACVPLVFDVGQRSTVVPIGVGRRC